MALGNAFLIWLPNKLSLPGKEARDSSQDYEEQGGEEWQRLDSTPRVLHPFWHIPDPAEPQVPHRGHVVPSPHLASALLLQRAPWPGGGWQ